MTLFQLKQNGKAIGWPMPEQEAHDQYLRLMWCFKDLTIEPVEGVRALEACYTNRAHGNRENDSGNGKAHQV